MWLDILSRYGSNQKYSLNNENKQKSYSDVSSNLIVITFVNFSFIAVCQDITYDKRESYCCYFNVVICSPQCASVIKQYNMVLTKGQWCSGWWKVMAAYHWIYAWCKFCYQYTQNYNISIHCTAAAVLCIVYLLHKRQLHLDWWTCSDHDHWRNPAAVFEL